MIAAHGRRGRPIIVLACILGGWIAARIVLWNGLPSPVHAVPAPPRDGVAQVPAARRMDDPDPPPIARGTEAHFILRSQAAMPFRAFPRERRYDRLPRGAPPIGHPASAPIPAQAQDADARPLPPWTPAIPSGPAARDRRWSADGWLILRSGGGAALAGGPAPATYGASQAGAVLRYRLDLSSGHRPAAYLRATAALEGVREQEAAIGLSARPVPALPIIAAAELRATRTPYGTRLRPAVMAVTQVAPVALPLAARAEAYAQVGYVGGNGATAFADGQLRVDRGAAGFGPARLRLGGGIWGGAQEGASRLDLGPAATIEMPGPAAGAARMSVDWRFRVAGHAAPASGPALTLSAGF